MGQIFTLSPDMVSTTQQFLDDMIGEFGKPCKLVYPPMTTPCLSCTGAAPRPAGMGALPNNIGVYGGFLGNPMGSVCAVCGGQGTIAKEAFDVVTFVVHYNPKQFAGTRIDVHRIAQGLLVTDGYLTDVPKVKRASYIIPDFNVTEGYSHLRYRLIEEPLTTSNIVKGRYFTALWERVQ